MHRQRKYPGDEEFSLRHSLCSFNLFLCLFAGNPTYETVYNADGDGMGIHSTGAGFEMVDELVMYTSDDF